MSKKVCKAVFPVAGMGTRFLPATKANPKEMLPIVDKPLLQYAVEEAIQAGITELIFVTNHAKYSIENYFDSNFELESRLMHAQKNDLLEIIQNIIPKHVSCLYIRQSEPLGLGDAVLKALPAIGYEPFAVLLADDLLDCHPKNCLQQMVEQFEQHSGSIIAVEKIPPEKTRQYGVVELMNHESNCSLLKAIVEKPEPQNAPSDLGVSGRYILTPNIFPCLRQISKGAGGELQLTDAIALLLQQENVYAYEFTGKRFDCGSKLGYLMATVEFGLRHAEIGPAFKQYLLDAFSPLE